MIYINQGALKKSWVTFLLVTSITKFFALSVYDPLLPWLVWLSGLGAGLQTEGSLVQLPVRARAWVAGQVPSWGREKGN